MKNLIWLLMACSTATFAQTDQQRLKDYNLKKGLALEGYDPVSYFSGKALEGEEKFSLTYRGITYRFATAENRKKFQSSPEQFEPAYGGWCAYAMGETGEKVKIDPETFKIIAGKLYLFYNFWGNNTLTDWNKNERSLIAKGDQHWKKFVP
jgi:YHS domain-containing protein